ncbi:hypothetical protein KUTeg_022756 [Tegillarca granosa]|uniref:Vinculin n=1 Tax=Tegillarca granosa TaxID=220873 RepID=A0ABQ9E2T0_TEGGR|nr:hypothetical protein KUTeg_022756 [Tegillarca granosa]
MSAVWQCEVSTLVILHEEAEDGHAMPDLGPLVQNVKLAVDNLVRVGYETINSSEDQILKQDMPPALNRVEEACLLLIQASDMLRNDAYSSAARKKLIEGARGAGFADAQANRDFVVRKMSDEIHEIIRVLQLTTYDEEEWDADDITVMKKSQSAIEQKIGKARDWLSDPTSLVGSAGEQATRLVVAEGRRVADYCTGPQRSELLRLCDETEILTNQLSDLIKKGQVAEDFIDISTPLKHLSEASVVPLGTPGREANFDDKARKFDDHAAKLAGTANMVATAGGCPNKKTVEEIFKTSAQKQWTDNMERLRGLVDEAVDTPALIRAEEEGILRDTDRVEDGIRANDPPTIGANVSNIARRANRILQVAQGEVENSEDPAFVDRVNDATEGLRATIAPMVQNAKAMSMNPRDANACTNWRKTNQQVRY